MIKLGFIEDFCFPDTCIRIFCFYFSVLIIFRLIIKLYRYGNTLLAYFWCTNMNVVRNYVMEF